MTHARPTPDTETRGWLRRIVSGCMRYRKQVILAFGASVAGMTITALVPLVQRTIIDDSILSHQRALGPLAALLIVAALASYGLTFMRRYMGGKLALDVQHDLRQEMFGALSRLDGARQDQLQTGQIIGRATSDITMVQGLLSMMPIMVGNLLLFVLSLVVMAVLSPLLTVVALAVGPGLLWISILARKRLFPATWEAQQQSAAVAAVVDDAVTGVRRSSASSTRLPAVSSARGCARPSSPPSTTRRCRRFRRSARSACSRWAVTLRSRATFPWVRSLRSPPTWPSSSGRYGRCRRCSPSASRPGRASSGYSR
jgi:ABC-type bacteriocin/lantibiotic exporter with double-glycine peptidase domain